MMLSLPIFTGKTTSSETQGQLVGREKVKTGEKKFGRKKVKRAKKSPWGQGFNGPGACFSKDPVN